MPVYPKKYATVIQRGSVWFTAKTEDGQELKLQIACKSGKGHRSDVQEGTKIKVYQKPTEDFFRYRLMGC